MGGPPFDDFQGMILQGPGKACGSLHNTQVQLETTS